MPPTSAIEMVQAFQAKGYPWTYPTFDKDDEICEAVIVEMRPGVSTVVDYYSFQDGYYISVEGGHVDYKEWDHVMEYLHSMWMPDAHPEPSTGQEMWESLDVWGYTTIDREYLDTQATATLYGGEKVVITLGDVGYLMEGTSHVTWRAVINHLFAIENKDVYENTPQIWVPVDPNLDKSKWTWTLVGGCDESLIYRTNLFLRSWVLSPWIEIEQHIRDGHLEEAQKKWSGMGDTVTHREAVWWAMDSLCPPAMQTKYGFRPFYLDPQPVERDWFLVLAQIVMVAIIVFTARVVYLHGGL